MAEQRPSLLQRLSDSLLPQDALSARYTIKTATESTPLLRSGSSTSIQIQAAAKSARKHAQNTRPTMTRAVTEPVTTTTSGSTEIAVPPVLSRPVLHRATTVANAHPATAQNQDKLVGPLRPSLLRRATDVVTASLAMNLQLAHRDGDKPAAPTFWADHIHRQPLLRAWDSMSHHNMSNESLTEQLVRVERTMSRQFGELSSGEVILTEEWITHVLGTCLRHPFCAGRWQKLATAAGPRGNWGPW